MDQQRLFAGVSAVLPRYAGEQICRSTTTMSLINDKIFTRDITRDEVIKIAKTSKLDLQGAALDEMLSSLNSIMPHIGKLNEVDTVGVTPFAHTYPTSSSGNGGVVPRRLGVDAMLRNAPKSRDGYYQVPRVIES